MAKANYQDEYQIRLEKLKKIRAARINPYPERFEKKHNVSEILGFKLGAKVQTAGRLLTIRGMGKIIFCHILDITGRIQLVLKEDEVGKENFKIFSQIFDPGDFIGVVGEVFKTQKGELSILIKTYQFLGKAFRPMPEKWHGLKDMELKYRQRYLDLIANNETYQRFLFRSELIKTLREFYWQNGFIEIETPILVNNPSGALAKPFKTHYEALDLDVYLRIAPETYLKEAIIGGFEKIFEIGRCFRNEGMDPSHLQDFTLAEHYVAYWNFEDNMKFTEELFVYLLKKLFGKTKLTIKDQSGKEQEIDFKPPWPKASFVELIKKESRLDLDKFETAEKLRAAIIAKKIKIDGIEKLGRGNLIDALYKTVCRDKITPPTFVLYQPADLSPLARKNDQNPEIVDRFQLVISGWEIVNAYSELVDPIDQKERFAKQAKAKATGDAEAHGKDDEFVLALEHGAPPISGWGMGLDRLVTLLTKQNNLRDVVLFPLLRPKK
ncbi:MAG: lysine--tRNA ligase [Candidatus Buchananbacteria bacterium RIFCSPHIGHO2_01_FULL_39_14]|uniref:Lysine--tRNA ligase n=1 Tax=Candidatus Buchananbacteria bacterium RIFCSPHIGHO2_01_FULL_39_14 TaxID=1797532 RepID=A0A1G1XWV9_9BACT|nr:MAG: lysine--tRNA ligase [Candidatus Buchananbacteria bacterium RIFCSPHIGHO2_01_FULL_39_14]